MTLAAQAQPLLTVKDLTIKLNLRVGDLRVVDGVEFSVMPGQTLAIVGESGCGKSVTANSLVGLLPRELTVSAGTACFEGRDLFKLPPHQLREVRGSRIGFVFQDPLTALNPVLTLGEQIAEGILAHRDIGWTAAEAEAKRLIDLVRIPNAAQRIDDYPHQLSGGQRQRIVIAIALANQPSLLIADEPTTALDVTIQAQIMRLLAHLQQELGMAMLLITHDLNLVSDVADRVMVMYAGRRVEERLASQALVDPRHPYTRALLASHPGHGIDAGGNRRALNDIPGSVPDLGRRPPGCAFAPRCGIARPTCEGTPPEMLALPDNGAVACPYSFRMDADPRPSRHQ